MRVEVGEGEAVRAEHVHLRVNSRRTSPGSTRPSAHRLRNGRHPDARRPRWSTSVGTSRASSTGPWWPTNARCAPTPRPESRSEPAASVRAGPFASADVLVTIPHAPARRMAWHTPGVRPKSSAFTMRSGPIMAGSNLDHWSLAAAQGTCAAGARSTWVRCALSGAAHPMLRYRVPMPGAPRLRICGASVRHSARMP